jgi:aminopeptidase N
MTLQALRSTVGDQTFYDILKHRVSDNRYGNESTGEFIALAEKISGKSLKPLFDTWLYAKKRPANPPSEGMSR